MADAYSKNVGKQHPVTNCFGVHQVSVLSYGPFDKGLQEDGYPKSPEVVPHSYRLVFEAHELHQLFRYITRKNHSYWSYVHQLSYGTGAPPCAHIALYIYIHTSHVT